MNEKSRPDVVLRYRDGRTLRAALAADFSPRTKELDVELTDQDEGQRITVKLDDLKAIFFLKDPRQRTADMGLGETVTLPGSALTRVEFFDGEIMRGQVQNYSIADAGFYLYSTATDSNHGKVFVVASALTTLAIEG